MMPGIEGGPAIVKDAYRGVRAAGVNQAIYVFDWQRATGLANLTDHAGNRRKAAAVASDILSYRHAYPDNPIDLVGYSGGGGMAVFIAEALPRTVRLRNIVLCQAALSPTYDLTRALARVEGQLINIHSDADWFILGAGTNVFGTMDRRNVSSAGKVGFRMKEAVRDPALREKLVQIAWDPSLIWEGYFGDHLQIMNYHWNKQFVAPHLQLPEQETPDSADPPGGVHDARK
jgi:pimeloyl-ACP methyl ester carboxylesterase